MAFQISPGVNVSEVDLTTVVPAVSTTTGAYAGQFQWGPVNKLTQITNETELVARFGKPDSNTATSFFSAANFLAYGNNLQVVRTANTETKNAAANAAAIVQIQSEDSYDNSHIPDSLTNSFVARYPGVLGNSLKFLFALQEQQTRTLYLIAGHTKAISVLLRALAHTLLLRAARTTRSTLQWWTKMVCSAMV